MQVVATDFAPLDPAFYQGDPDGAFRRLRAEDPLHWHEHATAGFWCVTKLADLQSISQRPRLFSSERGTQLFELDPARRAQMQRRTDVAPNIIRMDPPRHNRYRKLAIGPFTPGRIAGMEGRIRAIAKRSLDALDPSAPVELVEQIAIPLPMFVIAEMLGVPTEDYQDFRRWSDAMVAAGGGEHSDELAATIGELIQYLVDVANQRRRAPRDDLISLLLAAEVEGQRLSDAELGMFCLTLLVAGNETTRNLISGGALALMRNPDQRERLLAEPGLLGNAVEEMLRYVSPVRNFVRCATADVELRGRKIREGDYLALFYGSANRDEEVFGDDADAFDVARESARRHVAFGFGEHLCMGASLARLEGRVMFEELLARWPHFELAGQVEPLP
jgi:cytochrome P450